MDVSRQSISKWESAQSVPDLSRVIRMAELFGVSTDYLLKDDMESLEPVESMATAESSARLVTMEEANAFLSMRELNAQRISLGVLLCILCPVPVMLLVGTEQYGRFGLQEIHAVGISLILLFAMVGCAVALFVTSGLRSKRFSYLTEGPIETLYGVDGMVRERRDSFQPIFGRQLTLGIVLCVVAVLPIFIALTFVGEDSFAEVLSVGAMFVLIAVGVLLSVRSSMVWGGFQRLLEEGDYTREAKRDRVKHGYLGTIYWGLVTAAYLAVSFLTGAWERTWIIWPVTAVAYGAVFAIV
ncbi:MAG: helix-turn-helix transcriptional regulator, partial [Erysipelotrichaceae bacterium]|nr:helix-turn-helix transcriptional regulator [Erysipelotrichaceae bacterium]